MPAQYEMSLSGNAVDAKELGQKLVIFGAIHLICRDGQALRRAGEFAHRAIPLIKQVKLLAADFGDQVRVKDRGPIGQRLLNARR